MPIPACPTAKPIALGTSDFAEIIRESYLFIDKSLLIKEIINDPSKVVLITRPRRWGKTLNLSMLEHFFAANVNGQATAGLFDQLAIAQAEGGRYVRERQGKSPVIFLSFKDAKETDLPAAELAIFRQISTAYAKHRYLLESSKLPGDTTKLIEYFINWRNDFGRPDAASAAERARFADSLRVLSEALYQHYGHKAYIFLDEYDTPLNTAYLHGYVEELSDFMRNLLSAGLKDNPSLAKGVLTGILRVSKNSMLSGLNNLKCFSVLKNKYSPYFGFTAAEVEAVFKAQGEAAELAAVKAWYNGYNVGGLTLYNPWSILSCLSEQGELMPYWVATGDDRLVRDALLKGDSATQAQFHSLLSQGGVVEASVTENLTYEDLMRPGHLFSLLLSTGYLTPETVAPEKTHYRCQLRVPNYEVRCLYEDIFSGWLERELGAPRYQALLHSLAAGDIAQFQHLLGSYLLDTMSAYDFTSEAAFHTFVLGLISAVADTHLVYSNKEHGLGRPDCVLVPKDPQNTMGIILEFKFASIKNRQTNGGNNIEAMKARAQQLAQEAVGQIELRNYQAAFLQHPHVKTVHQIGLGFCQRCLAVASCTYNIADDSLGSAQQGQMFCGEE